MRSLTLRTTMRRAVVAAVVPLALGSLAACGNGGSTSAADPQADPPSSATSPSASTTGHASHPKNVDPAAFMNRIKAGARSLTTARFRMTMDVSGQTVYAKGALDMTGDQLAMQVSMDLTGMGTPTDMRIVDGVMYIQDPTSGSGSYLKMDLGDRNGPLGDLGDTLDSFDPNQMIGSMSPEAFRRVTDLGSQSVGGRQLEHYRIVLDTSVASKAFGSLPSTASLPKTMTYDAWLDSADRMAKFTMVMKKVSQITATYSDYGADVNITAPPASKVTEMPGSSAS